MPVEYKDYKIEIFLTPHFWDNEKEPYFWCILGLSNSEWVNTGSCGWALTPENAFQKANDCFNKKLPCRILHGCED